MILARAAEANLSRMAYHAAGLAVINRARLTESAAGTGQQQAEQKHQENEFEVGPHIQATELPRFWSVDNTRGGRCQLLFSPDNLESLTECGDTFSTCRAFGTLKTCRHILLLALTMSLTPAEDRLNSHRVTFLSASAERLKPTTQVTEGLVLGRCFLPGTMKR
jgi:hypothetical protein